MNFQDSGEARDIFNLITQKSMVKRNNKPSPSIHGLVVKPINSGHDRSIRPKLMKTSTLPNPSRPSGGNPMLLKSFSIDKGTGSNILWDFVCQHLS